jgi:arylsulfatase A-like enzyme
MPIQVNRRKLLAGAMAGVMALRHSSVRAQSATRPNILFIMADDLGYADLSCYGRPDIKTPHIDRLAAEGMRFTTAYANSAVCSATRLALMTGRYQYRLPAGLEEPIAARDVGLPPGLPTLPSLLGSAGYETALIGKWHLGRLPEYGPLKSGYRHFWGFRGGAVDYYTHANHGPDLWDGDTAITAAGYLTDLLGDRAVKMVSDFATLSRPFFLSLHFSAPHWPWEGPGDSAESDRLAKSSRPDALMNFDGGSQATYALMVQRLDEQVGRVLAELDRHGLADNTIVVFTSDNGGERFSNTWPFTGRKTELLEGGIRIPAIVRWPGHISAGSASDAQIMSMDWLPTLLSLAGTQAATAAPPDGIDIMPALLGRPLPERTLFWRYKAHNQQACRSGDWKYLQIDRNRFLFNVVTDPLERANMKDREPQRFTQLHSAWQTWNATMLKLDRKSYTHYFDSRELADHFGVRPSED